MQNSTSLNIIAFPRIHMTLIGMNSDGYRINGGIGFSISDPKIYSSYLPSRKYEIIDKREIGLTSAEKLKLITHLEKIKKEFNFKYSIKCVLYIASYILQY